MGGWAEGFVRDPSFICDIIPVDYSVNLMIATAALHR